MTITLYDYTPAPSPRRARILLAEKGIETENVQIDMGKAEQLTDEFKAINPGCTIPALKLEDGTVLTENAGIAARGKERLGHFLDMLNDRLEGRSYIATDQFSFADITAMVVVDFARWVKVVPGDGHANLNRWHADVSTRPSATA